MGRSRQELFGEIERAALSPLPDTPFEYAEWKQAKVHPDYHIEVLHSFYSVPHRLIGLHVDVRLTHRIVEIFHNTERVAVHHRRGPRGGHTTIKEHMPKAHQRHGGMSPESLIRRAARIGYHAAALVERLMRDRRSQKAPPEPFLPRLTPNRDIVLPSACSLCSGSSERTGWKRPATAP